jgi:hypothetical protein
VVQSKNRSCETQLLEFIDDVTKNMENSLQADVLIMDFSLKPFDKVGRLFLLSGKQSCHLQINGQLMLYRQGCH